MLASFFTGISLSCEEKEPCLDSDYRYILQRAWDESSNIQFIKIANGYLKKLENIKPDCGFQIERDSAE